jgi:hypothetical protein
MLAAVGVYEKLTMTETGGYHTPGGQCAPPA